MPSQTEREFCWVCRRSIVPLKDGTARNHVSQRGAEDWCPGAGYRMARWEVGQKLRHHSGDVWEIIEDVGGKWGDYALGCLAGREKGSEMIAHGEYMHRHGWKPINA